MRFKTTHELLKKSLDGHFSQPLQHLLQCVVEKLFGIFEVVNEFLKFLSIDEKPPPATARNFLVLRRQSMQVRSRQCQTHAVLSTIIDGNMSSKVKANHEIKTSDEMRQ